jgi:hypothetical protein
MRYVDVTLTLDTSAVADGDVAGNPVEIIGAVRQNGGYAKLQSIVVIDEDNVGVAGDLYFSQANTALGTLNSAPSITDANARTSLGVVQLAAADFRAIGSNLKIATKTGVNLIVKAVADTQSIFVGLIARAGATYTANGVRLRLGFED